MQGAAC
ncbi:hypothetical protein CP8484711_0692A, partial [Chlamydia psittaci 84-8471/1]